MCIIDELNKISGGLEKKCPQKTIKVSGGFSNKKNLEHEIVIGNYTNKFIQNRILEWNTFKSVYFSDEKLDHKYYSKFLDVLNDIFIMPMYTTDENEILYYITNIYKANPVSIINAIQKIILLNQPIKLAIKHLFMSYKIYIEKSIELYINVRKSYIEKNSLIKKNKENNLEMMLEKWHLIDSANKIDTSSPILFFNFTPTDVKLDKNIPKISWEINGASKKVRQKINDFNEAIKRCKFNYIGFCPHVANKRFIALLDFPMTELLAMIKVINPELNYDKIDTSCKKVCKKMIKIKNDIVKINKSKDNDIKIKKKKLDDITTFDKKSIDQKIKYFEKYIDAFLQLYKDLAPLIAKKEKHMNKIALSINDVASELQSVIDSL